MSDPITKLFHRWLEHWWREHHPAGGGGAPPTLAEAFEVGVDAPHAEQKVLLDEDLVLIRRKFS